MEQKKFSKTKIQSFCLTLMLTGCATAFMEANPSRVSDEVVAADEAYAKCMDDALTTGNFSRIQTRFILVSTYDYSAILKQNRIKPTQSDIQSLMDWFSKTQPCTAMALEQYGRIDPELALNISRTDKARTASFNALLSNKNTGQFNSQQRNFFNDRMLAVRNWAANLDNRTAELNSNYEWSLTQEDYAFVRSTVGKIPRYQAEVFLKQIDQLQVEQGKLNVAQSDYTNLNTNYKSVKIMNTSCTYDKNNKFICRQIFF